MGNKIQKLRVIEAPKELQLNNEELLDFLGGANCTGYDTSCWFFHNSSCDTYNSGVCSDGSSSDVYCIGYE